MISLQFLALKAKSPRMLMLLINIEKEVDLQEEAEDLYGWNCDVVVVLEVFQSSTFSCFDCQPQCLLCSCPR